MIRRLQHAVRSLLPAVSTGVAGFVAAVILSTIVAEQDADEQTRLFQRDATAALTEIEREIERHLDVVDDVTVFAEATWPGDLDQWRTYLGGRLAGGTYLAFTSTAGVIERVPADQLGIVEQREALSSAPLTIREVLRLGPDQDRLVLTRSITDDSSQRGLELTAAVEMLGLDLPGTENRIRVQSIVNAPAVVLNTLGIELVEFENEDVAGSDLLFVQAVGPDGEPPLGWIVVPANLAHLLDHVVEAIDGLSIAIEVVGSATDANAGMSGVLGRYDGAGDVPFAAADFRVTHRFDIGGLEWSIEMWANGAPTSGAGASLVILLAGTSIALILGVLVDMRRRNGRRLYEARIELSLQRTLAETDHLTGLLNRQGLASIRSQLGGGGAVLFADLDGFKQINDDYGHAAGDEVLVLLAAVMRSHARQGDVLVRLGGDEFVVVCPGLTEASTIDQRKRRLEFAVAAIPGPSPLRVSIGVAIADRSLSSELDMLLAAADAAMYEEKQRHRVTGPD